MRAEPHEQPVLLTAVDALSRATGWLSAAGLLAMLAMICFDVVMRYVFNAPTSWATEISTYVLIAIAFLGAGETHRQDGHIRVDLLVDRFAGVRRQRLLLLAAWVGLLYVAFAAWQAAAMTWSNYVNGTRIFSLLYTPVYLPQIPIVVGFVVLALAMLAEISRLAPPPAGWRSWAVPALTVALAVGLFLLGSRPVRIGATSYDWGAVMIVAAVLAGAWCWSGWHAALAVLAVAAAAAVPLALAADGGITAAIVVQAVVVLALLALGIRISLALGLVGLFAIYFLLGTPAPITIAERSWEAINTFTLTAVPMFVLMGALLLRSGISDEVFDTLVKWLGRVPGGLAHAGIGACGIFAAVSGSSLATAATMGMVACPDMVRRGYSRRLAYGSIAAGGTLGILIPPSVAMIIYGSTVGAPIAILFIAGIVPGLILVAAFMGVVLAWASLRPDSAPRGEAVGWAERFGSLARILPIAVLIAAVLGVLYAGVATPTEAGAIGAACALALCAVRRRLTVAVTAEVLMETVKVTSFLFLIIVGASVLTYAFDYLRLPAILVEAVRDAALAPWLVMLLVSVLYVVLGMFIDTISMMVMTLPVLFPMIVAMGFDPIWFGVVLVILMEIGLITPPVGVNLFVLRGIGDVELRDIVLGALPFVAVLAASVVLFYLAPGLITWLPSGMSR